MPWRRKAALPRWQRIARRADIHSGTGRWPRRAWPLRIGITDTRANPQCTAGHGAGTNGRDGALLYTHQVDSFDRHTRDMRKRWSIATPDYSRLPTGSRLNTCPTHQIGKRCRGRIDAIAIVGGHQIKQ